MVLKRNHLVAEVVANEEAVVATDEVVEEIAEAEEARERAAEDINLQNY